ncbi:MAG: hypothetical protein JXA93_10255 [Anaerolineae bacterium]|nr:hypothetical protein [Anaerolineae bacterium]
MAAGSSKRKGDALSKEAGQWNREDLRFLVETLVPERADPEHVIELLRDDDSLLDAMLQDDRVFRQLIDDESTLFSVSPHFFFKVLLMRTRRDMEREVYTVERRNLQRIALFDAHRVVDLLGCPEVIDYLAGLLALYSRIRNMTIPIRVRQGIWHRLKVNDLDVDSLIRYARFVKEENYFTIFRRIGDACLFLTGIFPEHISARTLYPHSREPRRRFMGSLFHDLDDYEGYGQAFYRRASNEAEAERLGLDEVLDILSRNFILAEKPLTFLATRYLSLRKHDLFKL